MIHLLIVGVGKMGCYHIKRFSSLKGVKICACVDHRYNRAKEVSETYGISYYSSNIERAMAETTPDGIVISTSTSGHIEAILVALKHNIPFFCEKPFTANWKETQKILCHYQNKSVPFGIINFSKRNAGAASKVKDILLQNTLGTIVHFEATYYQDWIPNHTFGSWEGDDSWLWRLQKGSSGILADLGSHLLDLTTWYFGVPSMLYCHTQSREKQHPNSRELTSPDSFIIQVAIGNIQGTLQGSWWTGGKRDSPQYKIYGTKGWMEIDLERNRYSVTIHTPFTTRQVSVKTKPNPLCEKFVHLIKKKQQNNLDISISDIFSRNYSSISSSFPDVRQGILVDYLLHLCTISEEEKRAVAPKETDTYKEWFL